MIQPLRITLLMAKTGGGHGAVADAVAQALMHSYGDAVEARVVDGLRGFAPFPISRLDSTYPWQVKLGGNGYGAAWRALNHTNRARRFMKSWWPFVRSAALRIVQMPTDVIVAVHPLFTYPCLWAMRRTGYRLPFITMISDLISSHALWCDPETDCLIAPTEICRLQAIAHGVAAEKIEVCGLPIRLKFSEPLKPRAEVRSRMNLQPNKRTIMLMGGGDGMGNLGQITRAVGFSGLDVQLIVAAGRNAKLKQQLDEVDWPVPVHVYGFTQEIPALMNASDVLITKAGPTSVAEALASELPTILSGFIPSQEEENVEYMVNIGAAVLVEKPARIVATLKSWLKSDSKLRQMSAAARAEARPRAAFDAADIIYKLASEKPLIIQPAQRDPLISSLGRFFGV